jgi:DNA-binding MarR family transcriptional regulator
MNDGEVVKRSSMTSIREGFVALPDDFLAGLAEEFPGVYEPDAAQISFVIRSTASRINDTTTFLLADHHLTARSINLLIAVFQHGKDGMPITVLGHYVHSAAATLTSAVQALERDGLVTRQADPADRRSIIVRLTAKGKRVTRSAFALHVTQLNRALRTLSKTERRTLLQLLGQINDGYDAWEAEHFGEPRSRHRHPSSITTKRT